MKVKFMYCDRYLAAGNERKKPTSTTKKKFGNWIPGYIL
jgi:hypothetical protein